MSGDPTFELRELFGLKISVLTRDAAVKFLENKICESVPVRLAFVNANLANMAFEDKYLREMLCKFMLLNDGVGIDFASRMLYGKHFPDNLNGTDFIPYFLDHCSVSLKVYLLGAKPTVIIRAADAFKKRWPRHKLVGFHDGYFSDADEEQIVEVIRAANPQLLLIAMGNGLQERWVMRMTGGVSLSSWGVGALFDFLSGEVHRAPLWLRRLKFEWAYRLILEPRRMWQRYVLGNPKFVLRVLIQRISRK